VEVADLIVFERDLHDIDMQVDGGSGGERRAIDFHHISVEEEGARILEHLRAIA
jgi:hypothetical protein